MFFQSWYIRCVELVEGDILEEDMFYGIADVSRTILFFSVNFNLDLSEICENNVASYKKWRRFLCIVYF